MLTPDQWAALGDVVQSIGIIGLLSIAIIAFYRGWIVRGSELAKSERRADESDARLDRLTDVLEGLLNARLPK